MYRTSYRSITSFARNAIRKKRGIFYTFFCKYASITINVLTTEKKKIIHSTVRRDDYCIKAVCFYVSPPLKRFYVSLIRV